MALCHPVHKCSLFFVKNAGPDGAACPLELPRWGTYNSTIGV